MQGPLRLSIDPLTEFFDAIKNPETKKRYTRRLEIFFDYIGVEGSTLQKKAKDFMHRARDPLWATYSINEYIRYQKDRAEKGKIEESTIPNFYKPIKLFCARALVETCHLDENIAYGVYGSITANHYYD